MTKRTRFAITSLLLTLGFAGVTLVENQMKFLGIAGLTIFATLLFVWSLREGLGLNATLLVLILPALFTLGIGLFWFLLPSTIVARFPVLILYGLVIYVLCLTKNIFIVSAIRTIALARAAKGVGFVLTLFTGFLLFDALLSIRATIILNAVLAFLISFPLFFQGLWNSRLSKDIPRSLIYYSLLFSYTLSTICTLLFFWPVSIVVGSIFLTVTIYVLLGLGQAKLEGRLFRQTAREYIYVGVLVFVVMFFVTSWRG